MGKRTRTWLIGPSLAFAASSLFSFSAWSIMAPGMGPTGNSREFEATAGTNYDADVKQVDGEVAQARAKLNQCRKNQEQAKKKCQEAYEEGRSVLDRNLEALKSGGYAGTLDQMIARFNAEADRLEQVADECKKDASASSAECIKGQAALDAAKSKAKETVVTVRAEQIRTVQEGLTTAWWKTDGIHAKDVPQIRQIVQEYRAEAARLEARKPAVEASGPSNGSNSPVTPAADQGTSRQAPGAVAAAAGQPQAANASAVASPELATMNPFTGVTTVGMLPTETFPAGDVAVPGGEPGSIEDVLTSTESEERRRLVEDPSTALPPLPSPEPETAKSSVAAAGLGGAPAGGAKPDVAPEKRDPARNAAPGTMAFTAGGGGGGGLARSSSSWWSSVKGTLGFGPAGADPARKPSSSDVDLSRFLPGHGPMGTVNLRRLGIHGPHVNMFDKLSERYHSLKGSLEP